MDIALAIQNILFGAEFGGCVNKNTSEQYDNIRWLDTRIPKPTWEELEVSWEQIKDLEIEEWEQNPNPEPKSYLELLEERITELEKLKIEEVK